MRIAAASSKGKYVDLHFGHAEKFYIFQKQETGLVLERVISVAPLSTGKRDHEFDADRFEAIAETLSGCRKVYCSKIGDRPRKELETRGIQVVLYTGGIDDLAC